MLSLGSKFSIPVNPWEVEIKDLIADVESVLDVVDESFESKDCQNNHQ